MSPRIQASQREIFLIVAGLAILAAGSFADTAINGVDPTDTAAMASAMKRLEAVPRIIGDWVSTDSELTQQELNVAGIESYVRREYRNQQTGFTVYVTILCGPSGPMAVHPPTACFQGVGYTLLTGPTPTSFSPKDDPSAASFGFNKSTFKQTNSHVTEFARVFWGWSDGEKWSAPTNPRLSFRSEPYLYKLYFVDRWLEETGRQSLPQIESFMEDALPVIAAALQEPASARQNATDQQAIPETSGSEL